jgi:proteasome lid subunit RPN8/RPN11
VAVDATRKALKQIIAIGNARAPHEACGLLIAQPKPAYDPIVLEISNCSATPETSFEFTSDQARAVIDDVLEGVELSDVLVWHTHPSNTDGPSSLDLSTRVAGVQYLVIHLPSGNAYRY